ARDVVRHPLVARVIEAYDADDAAALARGEDRDGRARWQPRRDPGSSRHAGEVVTGGAERIGLSDG
ncbi:MAG: hypothetical protein Q4G26_13510, partial [Paracoccus sp. (in: a-proteobacteria)]|nr:hypothetical protein [Paracoccus sp. (in: a-proteobacteria)]